MSLCRHVDELQQLVRELIEDGIDRIALAETLAIVDSFLLQPQPMTERQLTMDPTIGDLAQGDVLIDGARIAAVGPNLGRSRSAPTSFASM